MACEKLLRVRIKDIFCFINNSLKVDSNKFATRLHGKLLVYDNYCTYYEMRNKIIVKK